MSTTDITEGTSKERGVKTLAIRLEPDLHAQLSLIAQLRDSTITDEIRTALAAHIALVKDQPELAARADDVLEAIEREAVTRREAISTLFGTTPDTSEETVNPSGRSKTRKTATPSSGDTDSAS